MAPEIIRNEAYSTSADVYAFGVVVWEVCVRRMPFAECNPVQVRARASSASRRHSLAFFLYLSQFALVFYRSEGRGESEWDL